MFDQVVVSKESTGGAVAIPEFGGELKAGQIKETWADGRRTLQVGIGDEKDALTADQLAGVLARRLNLHEETAVDIAGEALDYQGLGLGFGLLTWDAGIFKGTKRKPRPSLSVALPSDAATEAFGKGMELARAINLSRTLSLTPPNIATTEYIAKQAEKLAEEVGLKCTVYKGKDLEKHRMEGLINVGKASEYGPCLVRLEYKPKGAKGKPLVLVGKTMVYDTGGLSLKPREGMVGMKQDKDGGCAVLGAMRAIATVYQPMRPVVALLCVAENSVSDEAYRPDDVLTFRNGVTVEVTNTDAEGRLVLADGLIWAAEEEKAAAVVDIATLTGGVVVALGSVYAGAFSNDDAWFDSVQEAADAAGERIWRLPLHEDYRKMMESDVADILNSNPKRVAHPIQGASFLSYFVPEGLPWAHLDIAGVHHADKASGPYEPGPNGWGVKLLAELASRF